MLQNKGGQILLCQLVTWWSCSCGDRSTFELFNICLQTGCLPSEIFSSSDVFQWVVTEWLGELIRVKHPPVLHLLTEKTSWSVHTYRGLWRHRRAGQQPGPPQILVNLSLAPNPYHDVCVFDQTPPLHRHLQLARTAECVTPSAPATIAAFPGS